MLLSSDPLVPWRLGPPDLPPGPPLSARNRDKASAMGLTSATGLDALFKMSSPSGMENRGIALIGLWVPAAVNLAGVRQMAWFQNVTVVLKFLPLRFVGVVGWFFVRRADLGPFNASGGSLYSGIGIAAGVALFPFIGVEAAAVTAKRVKDRRRNVSRASLIGTAVSAVLYVLVTAAVMGLVAHHALTTTGAPFVNAFDAIFPHSAWAGQFIAAVAVISGIVALNGWSLIVTETSRAIVQDDLFPRPFAWTGRNCTAWFGIVVGTVLPSGRQPAKHRAEGNRHDVPRRLRDGSAPPGHRPPPAP